MLGMMVWMQLEMEELARKLRREDGQTSIEYLGILVVVVAILGVIIAAAPGFGNSIVSKINSLISSLG